MTKRNTTRWLILGVVLVGVALSIWSFHTIVKTEEEKLYGSQAKLSKHAMLTGNSIALVKTNFGEIKIELFGEDAPKAVKNFIKLSTSNFYDGTKFHRVIRDFMIQGGDPNSKDDNWLNDGMGGPGYSFEDEINSHKMVRGALAMANSGPNTNGSQFFIVTTEAAPWLDGKHTVFGNVLEGMDVVDKIEDVKTNSSDHPTDDVVVESIQIIE